MKSTNSNNQIKWLLWHIALGLSVTLSSMLVTAWILGVLLYMFNSSVRLTKSSEWKIPLMLGYICGIELLARIARTTPFVPYEFGKYTFIVLTIIALFKFKGLKMSPGLWIVLFSLPGLLLIPADQYRYLLVNSFLGIFSLGLLAHALYNRPLYPAQVEELFRLILYGTTAILAAVTVRSPSFSQLDFVLGANFATSGGFGPNQVSTALGMGIMLTAMAFLLNMRLFAGRWTVLGVSIAHVFRALLTFSRGGILGAVISVLVAYLMPGTASRMRKIPLSTLLIIALGFFLSFRAVSYLSGNMLEARYRGENSNTIAGQGSVNATTLTTGRSDLMLAELKTFLDYPLLGIGPGAGFEAREKYYGQYSASHTEATRLLAEHGIPGVIMALIFLFFPVLRIRKLKSKRERTLVTAFFTLAIFTSMHSAMRTTITPFFWALGCMRFPEGFTTGATQSGGKDLTSYM